MSWYAVRTAPQREFAVEAGLRVKGYTCFAPSEFITRRSKRGAGPRAKIAVAKFPRYILVKGPIPWLDLMAERHVSGVVGFAGTPAPIADHIAMTVWRENGNDRPEVNKARALRTGDMAKISTGPFAGQLVKVEGLHGRKARVFLNLFGTRKSCEIATEQLEVA